MTGRPRQEARGLPATPCLCVNGPRQFRGDPCCHRCGRRVRPVSAAELAAARALEGLWLLGSRVDEAREKLNRECLDGCGLTFRELVRETYWHREAAAGLIV